MNLLCGSFKCTVVIISQRMKIVFFVFVFVHECKMKNCLCSWGKSVKWSSLGALCKSRQPAVISPSVALGDRPVNTHSTVTERSRVTPCKSWFVLLKMYWERCKVCPERHKPWSFSASRSRRADPGSDSVYILFLPLRFHLFFISSSCVAGLLTNCNICRVMENKLNYL